MVEKKQDETEEVEEEQTSDEITSLQESLTKMAEVGEGVMDIITFITKTKRAILKKSIEKVFDSNEEKWKELRKTFDEECMTWFLGEVKNMPPESLADPNVQAAITMLEQQLTNTPESDDSVDTGIMFW